ncbi:MAG: type IV secretion system DNA-binding domain-containing protein [Nitrospirota bacterium]|nr:type IV secretion system DNA-binding domain-containing protein [Nitrospirota bacterium]
MITPSPEHKDRPEADLFGLWTGSILIFTSFSFLGLVMGVLFSWGPSHFLTRALGLGAGGIFYYSKFASFLNSVLPDGFSNSWFGVQDFETLHNLAQLLPFLISGSALGLFLASVFFYRSHKNQTNPIKHLAGPKILEGPAGAKVLQKQIAEEFHVDGIFIHPGVQMSMRLEIQHFMLVGATGSGKTTEIFQLVDQIIARKDKMILHDVKSDFTQKLKKRLILAPWDRRSLRWLVGKDITSEALAQAFAECFIIANPKSPDPVWDNAARALLRAEIHKLQAHKPGKWTFLDLGKGLLDDLLVGVDDPQENMALLQKFIRTYYAEAWQIVRDATSRATSSVLFTQSGQLSALIDICRLDAALAREGRKGFWLDQDQGGFLSDSVFCPPVVLKKCPDSTKWSSTFISAFVNVAALKINGLGDADPDKRRLWFILDEVPQLGKIPEITQFLETARSKGIRMVLGLQNSEQIDKVYSKEDRAIWENQTVTKVLGQDVGKDAKKWASELVGTHTVQIFNRTVNTGTLPPSSNDSKNWSAPQEKRLLEEHAFEMLLRPRPKKKIVTALLQIAGFDRVILDWPMIPRPIHDPLEKDPVVLPPRVIVGENGQVIASNLAFVEGDLSSSPPPSVGGPEARREDTEKKREPVPTIPRLETVEIPRQQQKHQKAAPAKEDEIEEEASKIGEKMLLAGADLDFTGDSATDSLKLLAAMLDGSGASGTVGKITVAKTALAQEREDEEERD